MPDKRADTGSAAADESETTLCLASRPGAAAETGGKNFQPEQVRTGIAGSADEVQAVYDSRCVR